jgi:hypothetical protein
MEALSPGLLMSRSVWALVDEELAEHLTAHNTGDAK